MHFLKAGCTLLRACCWYWNLRSDFPVQSNKYHDNFLKVSLHWWLNHIIISVVYYCAHNNLHLKKVPVFWLTIFTEINVSGKFFQNDCSKLNLKADLVFTKSGMAQSSKDKAF